MSIKIKKPTRYFIASYRAYDKNNSHIFAHGDISFEVENGGFLNSKDTRDLILSRGTNKRNYNTVIITSILEVSEDDYKDWVE